MPVGFTSVPSPGGGTGGGGIFNPQNTVQKTIDNMTADELTVELDKATKTTEASKNDLNQIIDGTSPEIVQKQEAVDTAYNNFQSDLEKIDRELSVDLDTKKVEVEGIKENINTADVAINEQTFIYTTAKGAYDNAVQQILGLNSQITALETELSATSSSVMEPGAGSDNSVAIGEKLNAAKAELAIQEKRRDDNKDAYLAAEKEKNNQIKLKEGYVVQLAEAESQLAEFEAQVAELAGAKNSEGTPVNPELAASYEQYETLKTDLETFKTEARTKAQKAFDENLQYQNQVQAKLNEKQKAATEKDYSVTGLKLDYTLNGVDFDVVGIAGFDNLDDFMRQVQISGLTNTGEYGTMQCQNYSCAMIDLILGRANPELLAAFMAGDASGVDLAGYMARNKAYNNREYHAARPTDGTSYMQVLASELQQGRPCMVAIPRETTGTHYGICVGIRKGADYNNLQPSDFLIIDSYDAKPEIGGVTNSYSANKDVWVLTEGYRYENSGPKYVRYQDGQALV